MRLCQRLYPPLNRGDIVSDSLRARQSHNGLDHGERVASAVIDLARQQILTRFRFLALSEVDGDAANAHQTDLRS